MNHLHWVASRDLYDKEKDILARFWAEVLFPSLMDNLATLEAWATIVTTDCLLEDGSLQIERAHINNILPFLDNDRNFPLEETTAPSVSTEPDITSIDRPWVYRTTVNTNTGMGDSVATHTYYSSELYSFLWNKLQDPSAYRTEMREFFIELTHKDLMWYAYLVNTGSIVPTEVTTSGETFLQGVSPEWADLKSDFNTVNREAFDTAYDIRYA